MATDEQKEALRWRGVNNVGKAGELDGLAAPVSDIAQIIRNKGQVARLSGPQEANPRFAAIWAVGQLKRRKWDGIQVRMGRDEKGQRVAFIRLNLD